MRGYALHLIKQYNELSKKNHNQKKAYKYSIIYSNIEKEFGVTWQYIPKQRFKDLIFFLQARIDRTYIGKVNKSKGKRNYSSYEDFCNKRLKI